MRVLVLGGDGFCGWPTALRLARAGHEITIVDNLSRRRIDQELGAQSLSPIRSLDERVAAWNRLGHAPLEIAPIDIAEDYHSLRALLAGRAIGGLPRVRAVTLPAGLGGRTPVGYALPPDAGRAYRAAVIAIRRLCRRLSKYSSVSP
ncbi:hypothetical protein ACFQXB_14570 [Plastorhodobacter daqingensis]|uniref:NAD-dependent dehydratase n=1 Tax=Plastorhodobacter daqingensis TaxID=1387281 RepID=A0ABW2UPL3_9RHOB